MALHCTLDKGHNMNSVMIRYAAVKYPGVPAASIRMYAYLVLELDHTVPLPPTSDVEHP